MLLPTASVASVPLGEVDYQLSDQLQQLPLDSVEEIFTGSI